MSVPRHPLVAMLLSIILPGLGQLANGERAKGLAILCMVVGIALSCVVFRSLGTLVVMSLVYGAILVPAAVDASHVARGAKSPFSAEKPWYVIGALLVVGPFALPLLWQSHRFTQRAKWIWTVAVILLAVLGIAAMAAFGPVLDQFLDQFGASQ